MKSIGLYRLPSKSIEEIQLVPAPTAEPVVISTKQVLKEGDDCPFCGKKLVLRHGKNGNDFLGCTGFPKCRFSRRVAKIVQ